MDEQTHICPRCAERARKLDQLTEHLERLLAERQRMQKVIEELMERLAARAAA